MNAREIPLYTLNNKWENTIFTLLAFLGVCFSVYFFNTSSSSLVQLKGFFFELAFDKFSLFLSAVFCLSLFVGLYPVRKENEIDKSFIYYVLWGLGILLSNNLTTFFVFWTLQRSLPAILIFRSIRNSNTRGGGTYLIQHLTVFGCLLALIFLALNSGYATASFSEIPKSFFTWPVLILSFIIIYESHGIFPFHSWVHDLVGQFSWYKIAALFLARPGVLLFVKFLEPTIQHDPHIFTTMLLALSIFSSIYWSIRGIFETNVAQTTTYFSVAASSLLLTGLQADHTAALGTYLNLLVISLCGTSMWSMMSYIQRYTSIKRINQYYGLAQFYPNIATLFCLFGFCMIGTPLGASFVVEDLVINGLLDKQPYLGLGHILATCLNGILFFKVFTRLFLGTNAYPTKVNNFDLTRLQMLPYVAVLMVMFLIGIAPRLFLVNLQW